MIEVTTTYLETRSASDLRPRVALDPHFVVQEMTERDWRLNRSLYLAVGERWGWLDKRSWNEARWCAYVSSDNLRTFVGRHKESIAGYYELHRENSEVEISYFGLMSDFIGQGLGGALLTKAIEQAWLWEAKRVWVHTCSLDHPAALANYQARGLQIYATSTKSMPS